RDALITTGICIDSIIPNRTFRDRYDIMDFGARDSPKPGVKDVSVIYCIGFDPHRIAPSREVEAGRKVSYDHTRTNAKDRIVRQRLRAARRRPEAVPQGDVAIQV